jgi:hypothetical protein
VNGVTVDLREHGKRTAHKALIDRILGGDGQAPREQRRAAFEDAGMEPLRALVGKVATTPTRVTDEDFAAAKAAGYSEDQIFELVVCDAVGQSTRPYEAGLDASGLLRE